jgi:hypothetical protein
MVSFVLHAIPNIQTGLAWGDKNFVLKTKAKMGAN